jgi:hypothetical protein
VRICGEFVRLIGLVYHWCVSSSGGRWFYSCQPNNMKQQLTVMRLSCVNVCIHAGKSAECIEK